MKKQQTTEKNKLWNGHVRVRNLTEMLCHDLQRGVHAKVREMLDERTEILISSYRKCLV